MRRTTQMILRRLAPILSAAMLLSKNVVIANRGISSASVNLVCTAPNIKLLLITTAFSEFHIKPAVPHFGILRATSDYSDPACMKRLPASYPCIQVSCSVVSFLNFGIQSYSHYCELTCTPRQIFSILVNRS